MRGGRDKKNTGMERMDGGKGTKNRYFEDEARSGKKPGIVRMKERGSGRGNDGGGIGGGGGGEITPATTTTN